MKEMPNTPGRLTLPHHYPNHRSYYEIERTPPPPPICKTVLRFYLPDAFVEAPRATGGRGNAESWLRWVANHPISSEERQLIERVRGILARWHPFLPTQFCELTTDDETMDGYLRLGSAYQVPIWAIYIGMWETFTSIPDWWDRPIKRGGRRRKNPGNVVEFCKIL